MRDTLEGAPSNPWSKSPTAEQPSLQETLMKRQLPTSQAGQPYRGVNDGLSVSQPQIPMDPAPRAVDINPPMGGGTLSNDFHEYPLKQEDLWKKLMPESQAPGGLGPLMQDLFKQQRNY